MMGWHYQIRRYKVGGVKWMYDIVEKFPMGHTMAGMAPMGDSRKEIIKCLENMLKDAKKYKTLTEKEGKQCQDH